MSVEAGSDRSRGSFASSGVDMARRAADGLLALFVPKLDQPVQAADCWYQSECLHPVLRQRHCCRRPGGGVTCGGWSQIGYC